MLFQRRPSREILHILVLALIPLAAPLAFPPEERVEDISPGRFDQHTWNRITSRKPDIVLVGNSMTNSRVDKRLFADLTAPLRSFVLAEGGTRSAVWYFMLRNFVAPLEPPPDIVFLFYRDYDFADPGAHLTGEYLSVARTYLREGDEALMEFCIHAGGSAPHPILEGYLPLRPAEKARGRIREWALDVAVTGAGPDAEEEVERGIQDLFDFSNLRTDVFDDPLEPVSDDLTVFTAEPSRNLLTRFAALAQERGFRLCFYRVKSRPDPDGTVYESPALVEYTGSLKQWAESQGCLFLDETHDPRITLSMYHDGDHVGRHAMADWTRIFVERIRPLLPRVPDEP